jgi:hypothetical protein
MTLPPGATGGRPRQRGARAVAGRRGRAQSFAHNRHRPPCLSCMDGPARWPPGVARGRRRRARRSKLAAALMLERVRPRGFALRIPDDGQNSSSLAFRCYSPRLSVQRERPGLSPSCHTCVSE